MSPLTDDSPDTSGRDLPPGPRLRERKREATRSALRQAALHRFRAQGFETTTVQEIADDVGVAERTFFRYFASKEDVLLEDLAAMGPRLATALTRRPPHERLITALRHALRDIEDDADVQALFVGLAPLLLQAFPTVGTAADTEVSALPPRLLLALAGRIETSLVPALRTRAEALGVPPAAAQVQAEVVALAGLGAIRTAVTAQYRAGGTVGVYGRVLRQAFDALDPP